jgi:type I restriction enzyme S subunit
MYGGKIGKIGLSTIDAYCNQSVGVLPANPKVNNKYYYYWFLSAQEQVKLLGRGGGQPNINKEMIKEFPSMIVPLSEQSEIVEYLDEKTAETDAAMELEHQKIALLKEYRQSLISSVVTGKIKVTDE